MHEDAVEAAHEWRDEEREKSAGTKRQPCEVVWVDTGSGWGYEVLVPQSRLRPDRDKLS